MKLTMRWYGKSDIIPLDYIKQIRYACCECDL